jgi:hypothetical protein
MEHDAAPALSPKLPEAHKWQAEMEALFELGLNVPAGHSEQNGAPLAAKEPAGHTSQAPVSGFRNAPAAHKMDTTRTLPDAPALAGASSRAKQRNLRGLKPR